MSLSISFRHSHALRPVVLACLLTASSHLWAQAPNPFLGLLKAQSTAAPAPAPAPAAAPTLKPAIAPGSTFSPAPVSPSSSAPAPAPSVESGAATPKPAEAGSAPPATTTNPPAAAQPSPSIQGLSGGGVSLRFDNADIVDVVQAVMGDVLKLDYLLDPAVQGRVTFRSSSAVQPAHLLGVLETALASQGFAISKQGNLYRVLPDANMGRVAELSKEPGSTTGPVLQVMPLMFVQAQQLAVTLKAFASPQAIILPDPTNKYLIVVDRASAVDRLVSMVALLDVDYLQNVSVQMFKLNHASAADIARELEGIFKTSGLYNAPNTEAAKAHIIPIGRMNAVLVAGANAKITEYAKKWIASLDVPLDKDVDAFVHVYPVQSSNATHLAGLLQQMFGGASGAAGAAGGASRSAAGSGFGSQGSQSGGTGAGGFAGQGQQGQASGAASSTSTISRGNTPSPAAVSVSDGSVGIAGGIQIIADEVTNSLIIRASADDYQRIRRVIGKIDATPKQVLIQVVVAEVSLNDTLQYGVEWWLKSNLTNKGKSWAARAGLDGLIKAPSALGTVSGVGSGFNYAVLNSSSQVIGLLNLLGQDTNVNLLSAPHVMASDGKVARVEIGNDEPVVTQTLQTPTTTLGQLTTSNSVQYRATGILLEVKPTISASGAVSLSVSQEVSNRAANVSVGGSEYPSFSKRKVSTDVVVEEGKTVVIAGLIEDKGDGSSVGLPGLKDVPLFGALFGSTRKVSTKTELLISITPYIVQNQTEADRLSNAFQSTLASLNDVVKVGREKIQLNARPLPLTTDTAEPLLKP